MRLLITLCLGLLFSAAAAPLNNKPRQCVISSRMAGSPVERVESARSILLAGVVPPGGNAALKT